MALCAPEICTIQKWSGNMNRRFERKDPLAMRTGKQQACGGVHAHKKKLFHAETCGLMDWCAQLQYEFLGVFTINFLSKGESTILDLRAPDILALSLRGEGKCQHWAEIRGTHTHTHTHSRRAHCIDKQANAKIKKVYVSQQDLHFVFMKDMYLSSKIFSFIISSCMQYFSLPSFSLTSSL
jgi:hypothetical protein